MSEATETARNSVIARCRQTDFQSMSKETFGDWINALPQDEFFALIGLHDEFGAKGKIAAPTAIVNVEPLGNRPDDDAWIVYTGDEGALPVPPETMIWTLYPDGGVEGPNRADAFLWGDSGKAEIVAYQEYAGELS